MAAAECARLGGGFVVAERGQVVARVPMPLYGLLSEQPVDLLADDIGAAIEALRRPRLQASIAVPHARLHRPAGIHRQAQDFLCRSRRCLARRGRPAVRFVSAMETLDLGGVTVQRDHPVPMRDGVTLAADVYRPSGVREPLPVLLQRTPYNKRFAQTGVYQHPAWYARHGFVVVVQDTRGRFASEGAFEPYAREAEDGADTIGWAAALAQYHRTGRHLRLLLCRHEPDVDGPARSVHRSPAWRSAAPPAISTMAGRIAAAPCSSPSSCPGPSRRWRDRMQSAGTTSSTAERSATGRSMCRKPTSDRCAPGSNPATSPNSSPTGSSTNRATIIGRRWSAPHRIASWPFHAYI